MARLSNYFLLFLLLGVSNVSMAIFTKPEFTTVNIKPIPFEEIASDSFNSMLQRKILEVLVVQLFEDNKDVALAYGFAGSWEFNTSLFTVNVATTDSDSYLLNLRDHLSGNEIHIDIPIFYSSMSPLMASYSLK